MALTDEIEGRETATITERTRYLCDRRLLARTRLADSKGPDLPENDEPEYFHADLVGSTMLRTDAKGAVIPATAHCGVTKVLSYTAFGEPIAPDSAGGWTIGLA